DSLQHQGQTLGEGEVLRKWRDLAPVKPVREAGFGHQALSLLKVERPWWQLERAGKVFGNPTAFELTESAAFNLDNQFAVDGQIDGLANLQVAKGVVRLVEARVHQPITTTRHVSQLQPLIFLDHFDELLIERGCHIYLTGLEGR